jgi:hypothetical protein
VIAGILEARSREAALSILVLSLLVPATARTQPFTFDPPGDLVPGSGMGRADSMVYAPGIRFPIEVGPAFANSQVWGHGGSSGPGGSECDSENFVYPWQDNFCETRTWTMPLCPAGTGHQGQDVRASTCEPNVHWVVAITDGTITHIGSYTVYLTAADGTRYDYLHMDSVQVTVGQTVVRGQHVGKVSHMFGGSTTTVHLHFNIQQNVAGVGTVFVPPYPSLIQAYETLLAGSPQDAGSSDTATDAALDASGSSFDAGNPIDQVDAGTIADAGSIADADSIADAGGQTSADALDSTGQDQRKAHAGGCTCSRRGNASFGLFSMLVAALAFSRRRALGPRSRKKN